MPNDPMQFVNPIIQSLVHSATLQQNRAKLQQEADQYKQDAELRKHQQQVHEQQIEREASHQTGMLEVQKKLAEASVEANRLNRLKQGAELLHSGLKPEDFGQIMNAIGSANGQTATPPAGGVPWLSGNDVRTQHPTGPPAPPTPPEFQNSPPPTPQADIGQRLRDIENQQLANRTKLVTTAQQEALEPFQIRAADREYNDKKKLMDWENQFKEKMQGAQLASHERIAELQRSTQKAIADAANATHLKIAGMQYVPTDDTRKQMIVAFATGIQKPNLANPVERAAWTSAREAGFRDVDPKEAAALREGQQLIPLFDRLKTFAEKLPDTKTGAFVQGKVLHAANWVGWPTDTQNELNRIFSQALVVGRTIEGLTGGRVLAKQMELDLNSITSGGISRSQALKRLNGLRELYTNKQENMLMGGMNDTQKDLIRHTYGIVPTDSGQKPDWLKVAPARNRNGKPLNESESIKVGHPVYGGND